MKAEFFDDVINPDKAKSVAFQYKKKLDVFKRKLPEEFEHDDYFDLDDDDEDDDDEDDDDYPFSEPYRREEPKVGRNDPCPSGSGKKYKKCCGKE